MTCATMCKSSSPRSAHDQINDIDVLAINAASAALIITDVPFTTPVGAVRVGLD